MPFDPDQSQPAPPSGTGGTDDSAAARHRRQVAWWLFTVAGLVFLMVCIGGATRLTGSGLSIMEWRPFTGWLPPVSEAEWSRLFDIYRTIPQYTQLNAGMSLAEFKGIFWLEYIHRVWGRLIGVAFLLPFLWFLATGRLERALAPRLALLFGLGALQGFIGWFMVASGFFPDHLAVSPYRLVVHLGMAFVIYVALLWTALDLLRPAPMPLPVPLDAAAASLRRLVWGTGALLVLAMLAGGFVAGTRAGFTYNTFPLMDGRLVPDGYWQASPWWISTFQDVATVQFNHRLVASLGLLAALAIAVSATRGPLPVALTRPVLWLGAVALVQYALGVLTLLLVVPVPLGTLHQGFAVIVLTVLVWAMHGLRGSRADPHR